MGDTQGKRQVQPVKAEKVEGGRDSVEVEAWDSLFFRATGMGKIENKKQCRTVNLRATQHPIFCSDTSPP